MSLSVISWTVPEQVKFPQLPKAWRTEDPLWTINQFYRELIGQREMLLYLLICNLKHYLQFSPTPTMKDRPHVAKCMNVKELGSSSLFFCRDLTILVPGLASPHANVPSNWIPPDIFWRGTVSTSRAMLHPRLFPHCTRIIMAGSQTCFPAFLWRSGTMHRVQKHTFPEFILMF